MIQIVLSLVLAWHSVLINSPATGKVYKETAATQNNVAFRYVIYDNKTHNVGPFSSRQVKVLLESEAFSQTTLEELFRLLSKRFPEPYDLTIDVYTSLKQTKTPEEMEVGEVTEGPDNPEIDKYHRAVLLRHNGNELFRYNLDPPSRKMKTVILKGKDSSGSK